MPIPAMAMPAVMRRQSSRASRAESSARSVSGVTCSPCSAACRTAFVIASACRGSRPAAVKFASDGVRIKHPDQKHTVCAAASAPAVAGREGTARPTGFLRPNSKWSRRLRAHADPRLWETAVLFHLRDAFRAGDVWLARSRRYRDVRRTLLAIPAVPDVDRSLPVPASP